MGKRNERAPEITLNPYFHVVNVVVHVQCTVFGIHTDR